MSEEINLKKVYTLEIIAKKINNKEVNAYIETAFGKYKIAYIDMENWTVHVGKELSRRTLYCTPKSKVEVEA